MVLPTSSDRSAPVVPGAWLLAVRRVAWSGVLISLLAGPGCMRAVRTAHAAPRTDAGEGQPAKEWPTPDEVIEMLDGHLSLTNDQKSRLRPIIVARQEQLRALAADGSAGLARGRRARSILEDSDRSIEALLSEKQKEQYRALREQLRAQAKDRMRQR
jgi:hypothetical protein